MSAEDPTDGGLYNTGPPIHANTTAGTSQRNPPTTIDRVATKDGSVTRVPEPLTDDNWTVWKNRMKPILGMCDIEGYVDGSIPCPANSLQAKNWAFNDNYAQCIIMNNLTSSDMIQVGDCKTAHNLWTNLEAIHESKGHLTIIAIMRNLFHTVAAEGANISEHLTQLKIHWERIQGIGDDEIKLTDFIFKILISSSLPRSWDQFTESYVGGHVGIKDSNPKKQLTSQQFIGILKEEYFRRLTRNRKEEATNQALASRITSSKADQEHDTCKHCGKRGHQAANCIYLGKSKCQDCGKFHATKECWKCDKCGMRGHLAKDCWGDDKNKKKRKRGGKNSKGKANKAAKTESASIAVIEESTNVAMIQDGMTFCAQESGASLLSRLGGEDTMGEKRISDDDEQYIYETYDPTDPNDESLGWYDWLADCATTSHICNDRESFKTYQPENDTTVAGVGNVKTNVKGRGTVELISTYNGHAYSMKLTNVLHIPSNRNNLLSLGRLDAAGGGYSSTNGLLTLTSADRMTIAEGIKVSGNLYKMRVTVKKNIPVDTPKNGRVFQANDTSQNWETWHKRFGHVSYSGLRRLYQEKMVNGLTVDPNTPTPDCVACTEAKQHIEPFDKSQRKELEPGNLTHVDLWGKYDVASIHANLYYIVLIDDASRFITVDFLKTKDQASQKVKNYLTYLRTQGRNPKAMRTDRGKEFINDQLSPWCRERGIEVQTTAPYSPSQNGVAERSNRTLVELARAMIKAQDLPEFLWEPAVKHAAYLRNRSATRTIKDKTPYELWHGKKPDVSHLREFGAPVWVLLQGQYEARKIQPKSKRRAFVGYDDGSKSVNYYNAETRKILTSRNFRFLTLTEKVTPPEQIVVAPDLPLEGENEGGAQPTGLNQNLKQKQSDDSKRKRDESEEDEVDTPLRKTRGKRVDYRRLNNPFAYRDKEEEEDEDDVAQETYAAIAESCPGGDEPKSLKQAKESPEWEEWKRAVKSEMDQLQKMGTWILVEKPTDAIPISNRWVFIKKYNKQGDLLKYKGRLVAKGCAQRPGHDYQETYAPVVRMETLRVILAIAIIKGYSILQMDVKGAYLNGTLKEKVYMTQPEGHNDGTGRVCLLVKTLYGLKQSGREWNKELDAKLKKYAFTRLKSDPCVYVRRKGDDVAIITVWVDDLLLFASSDDILQSVKTQLCAEWEITDLGEPSKIIGIEITRIRDGIKISQEKYVESILKREGMEGANPVSTPMDPHEKLVPNPDGNEGNRSNSYARLLGELQFLANATRPDIAFAVNKLSAYTANPSLQHTGALKRILRYLAGTKSYAITYSKYHPQRVLEGQNLFHGYADAAYNNTDDRKSTSGYVFQMGGGAVTWRSKKQSTIALSSTEAEYVALCEAGREACWLRNLLEELGESQLSPTLIKGDNDGSIAMARNPQFHKRSKHIETKWHWVRDMVENETIALESCRDPDQTADVLTKPLPRPKYRKHVTEMGLATT